MGCGRPRSSARARTAGERLGGAAEDLLDRSAVATVGDRHLGAEPRLRLGEAEDDLRRPALRRIERREDVHDPKGSRRVGLSQHGSSHHRPASIGTLADSTSTEAPSGGIGSSGREKYSRCSRPIRIRSPKRSGVPSMLPCLLERSR